MCIVNSAEYTHNQTLSAIFPQIFPQTQKILILDSKFNFLIFISRANHKSNNLFIVKESNIALYSVSANIVSASNS